MTIGSEALDNGGKLQPAQGLPGGSGILSEDERDAELPKGFWDFLGAGAVAKGMAPLWGSPAGKKYLAGMIVGLLPEHKTYVEPFVGGGAVFWRKEPSEVEVLGDMDPDVAFSWKFAQKVTDEQIAKLESFNWTSTRARFVELRKVEPSNDVQRFYKTRLVRWASFYNDGRTVNPMRLGQTFTMVGRLARGRDRLKGVKISEASYEKLIKEHDSKDTVFFLDPPYPEYNQNVGERSFDGEKFAEVLRSIKGKFLVTYGPKSDLSPFKGFETRKVTTASVTPRGGTAQKVTVLISNYPLPKRIQKAKKPESQGMMVALMLPKTAATELALSPLPEKVGRALGPDSLHLTLTYLGKIGEATREELEGLVLERTRRAISAAVSAHPPIEGKISGFGRFKEGALYASFDSPGLSTLQEAIAAALDGEGAAFAKEHGFTPHITLAFLEDGAETPDLTKLPKLALRFDHVSLMVGGEQEEFPLGGALAAEPEDLTTKELVAVHKYVHSRYNGHEILRRGGSWFYADIDEPVAAVPRRTCGHCGRSSTAEGHDGCLGTLPGVMNACCGHGVEREAYVRFIGGESVHGSDATLAQWSMPKSSDRLLELHARVTDELQKRGAPQLPPANELDAVSKAMEPWTKNDRRFAHVCRSGVELGPPIKLEDVMGRLSKGFQIAKPAIYLVGGLAVHGETRGDIDILLRLPPDTSPATRHAIEFRLGRALGPELAPRMSVMLDDYHGPFTDHVPLFDLEFTPSAQRERKEMRLSAEPAAVLKNKGLSAEAEQSREADRVEVGRFFHMSKPACSAMPEQSQTVKRLVRLYEERADDWLPTIAQKISRGAHHQIHKNGDKVLVISEDGEDNTDRFPKLVEAVQKLRPEKLVLAAEIEQWDGVQLCKREAVSTYLSSKETPDDEAAGIVANVYDILLVDGEDIHKAQIEVRLAELAGIGLPQATESRPDLQHRLNRVPSHHAQTVEQLERVTRSLQLLPSSEGAVFKRAGSSYRLEQSTKDDWVKFHSAAAPKSQVRKGKTAAALLVEAGPPNEWSGGVAAALGKLGRQRVAALWNALSKPDRQRVMAAFHKMFDAVDCFLDLEDSYGPIAKQKDPYLEIPPEDGTYRFVVQMHFRGKSVHGDLRFELRPKKLLIGWTLDVQIAGAQKAPVVSLAEARTAVAGDRMGKLSKIDFRSGDWAERPRRGASKPVRTLIKAQRKAPQPAAWLNVEGETEKPDRGEKPAAGATAKFPGVFHIVDSGGVEYLAQKATTHEYAFHGRGLNYRMFFRLLRLEKRVMKQLEPRLCEKCRTEPAVFDALPADCSEPPAAVCDDCVDSWAAGNHGTVISKQRVLPPSKPPKDGPFAEETWFAIRPDDQRPNVLQPDEVVKGWMPPLGISALPKAVRAQVPKELRYWTTKTSKRAKDLRDELVEGLSKGTVEIDFEAPFKRTTKAAPRFVLQEQIWRGPIQVRLGPTRQIWWVRIDTGKGKALEIELRRSPIDNTEVSAAVGNTSLSTLDAAGEVPPGTALNPSKDTPSFIVQQDRGAATIIERTDDRIVLELQGDKLDGVFELRRRDGSTWIWRRLEDTRKFIPLIKAQEAEGIVIGVVMEPEEVDGQGEITSKKVIREAAYRYLSRFGRSDGTKLGDMHKVFGQVGWDLVESWVQMGDTVIGEEKVKDGTWLMTWRKTPDAAGDAAWDQVKRGKRKGFSIGGHAKIV